MTEVVTNLERLWLKRYGIKRPDDLPIQWNDTMDLLTRHRTVRKFVPGAIGDDVVNSLVLAAQSAATGGNLQMWSVVVVRDPQLIAEIAAVCTQAHVGKAPMLMIWLADFSRFYELAHGLGKEAASLEYLDPFMSGVFDVGIASQAAIVAAESLGLGTVYLGSIRNDVARIADLLELPDHIFPVVGLSVGYPDPTEDADMKPRLPMRAIAHHEKYDPSVFADAVEEYEPISATYYRRYGLGESWRERVEERAIDGNSDRNKEYIPGWLRSRGFGLK